MAQAGRASEKRGGGGKERAGPAWAEIRERKGDSFLFLIQIFKALFNLNFEPKLFSSNSHIIK